jgi:hypothetical protein
MKKVVALAEVYYDGKTRQPGDTFEMEDKWVPILAHCGKLKEDEPGTQPQQDPPQARPPAAPPRQQPKLESAAVTPMDSSNDALTQPKRRQYKRRDLRSED